MKEKRSRKLSNVYTYILSFAASAIGILLNFFLARILEAEAYGEIQYYVALSTTISQFLVLGMNTFLIKEAGDASKKAAIFSKCFSLYLVVILFGLPIVSFFLKTDDSLNSFISFMIIAVSLLMGIDTLISSYFHGVGKYKLTIILENLVPKAFLLLVSVLFFALQRTSQLTSLYLVFYVLIYGVIAIPILVKLLRGINISFTNAEMKSIFFFFGVTVTYSLGNNLTKVLQGGLYQNNVALAIISVSLSIISLVKIFTSVLDSIVKPLFARLKRENKNNELLDTYRFDTRMNSYVSIPLYLFFILHPERFLSIFGTSYTTYPIILVLLSIANMISDMTGPNGTMLAMTGHEKWELFNGLLYFGTYIACVFIFSYDKIYGLCIALLLGQAVVNIAKYIEIFILYKVNPLDIKTILSLLIIMVIDGGLIFVLKYIPTFWLWLAVGVVSGMIIVLLNCFVLSLYRKKDFRTLIEIRS